jgi:PKD domain/Secretion system C-terminal sorting domain/IPT/TIG domain
MKNIFSALFVLALFSTASAQCLLREIPLAQRANASSLIVEGKVLAQTSFWNDQHTMIYTASTIDVYKIFKGSFTGTQIEVISEGGTVGLNRITVEPSLELSSDEVGVFTCEAVSHVKGTITRASSIPLFEVYSSVQGFIKYDLETNTATDPFSTYNDIENEVFGTILPTGQQYTTVQAFNRTSNRINPNFNVAAITGFNPSTVTAGTGTTITITGTAFGATRGTGSVGFKNADDGGATYFTALATDYVSWNNTQIVVRVPSGAGTGTIQVTQGTTSTSSATLTVNYNHLNVQFDPGAGLQHFETDHINDNGTGGYTWRMNTGFDASTSARASFMRAFDTWRCNTSVNWSIGATTSINDALSDGTNVICFDNTAPLGAGFLGVCYSYWSGCAAMSSIVWYVDELDIIFDEGSNISPLTWQFGPSLPSGSQYDFETVAVHELGHGHQLGHVIAPGAIMHYAISNGSSNRSLGSNDLAGGNYVQAKSVVVNACGPGAMTNFVCAGPPVAAFIGSPTTVCAGGTVAFTDQSTNTPTSWAWTFTGGTPSSSTLQNPTITYTTPGNYAVTLVATNGNGSGTVTLTGYIAVSSRPSLSINSNPVGATVCSGAQVTLTASGASTYSWTGGITNGVAFTPPSTLTYTVTGTAANGCTNTATQLVTVNSNPTITVTANPSSATVCNGSQVTLTAGGASSYSWTGGITNGVVFTPPGTQTYTVTGTNASGCTATTTRLVTVNPSPTITANVSPSSTVCSGTLVTLTGSGANSYTWSGGVTNGVPFAASGTTTYTVTGTDLNGCTGTATQLLTVNTSPTITVTSNPPGATVCAGAQVTLTASGASTYSWSGGITNALAFTPAGTLTYTVTGTAANGCTATNTQLVTVNSNPVITISSNPSNAIVCSGSQATLTANGASSYSWTGGISNGVAFTPGATTTYTVTGTSASGCTATATQLVTVNLSLSITVNTSPATNVCSGTAVTLSGSGANTYSWTGGVTDGVPFTPTSTLTYTVTGTDLSGCTGTASQQIVVNPIPSVSASASPSASVCTGTMVTMTGGGANSYTWSGGISNGVPFAASNTITYTVTGTDLNGCTGTATQLLTVNSLPTISVVSNPSNGTICTGGLATLTASGANTYSWTGGIINGLPFTPPFTTTYTVTGTSASGCTGTASRTITVNNCSGPTSSLPCGLTFTKKNTNVSAVNVVGAVNYRFTFYDNVTNIQVAQRIQTSRTLTLSNVSGIYYNTTYKWTVAVDMGTGFGPESSLACTIIFGPAQSTVPCGVTYTNMTAYTTAVAAGNISGYRFTFYDNVTNAMVAQRTQQSNYIYFNTVSGLLYGTTYKWTVAVEYPLSGGGTAFGPESSNTCTITFAAPRTTVPCNGTYTRATSYTVATAVYGATSYRFTFYLASVQVAQRTQTSNLIYFNQVSGITSNQAYTWTVEVQYNSLSGPAFGPASVACPITFGPGSMAESSNLNSPTREGETDQPVEETISVYPNPTQGLIHINANEPIKAIYVYSVTGELMLTETQSNEISLENFAIGTYFILVETETGIKRSTVIRE